MLIFTTIDCELSVKFGYATVLHPRDISMKFSCIWRNMPNLECLFKNQKRQIARNQIIEIHITMLSKLEERGAEYFLYIT